ncbi:ABC transporter substrate-binding protein [Shewanella gelidii]|nr:ABC transporter substrate binding protein [Shewanella gelidii]MCL1097334.1 sugar ABC transporter [Shewanella gelidii]
MNTLCRCLFLCLAIVGAVMSPSAIAEAKKVLVIQSYHAEYPWDKSYLKGIRQTLDGNYEIETFQMDTKRVPKDAYQQQADKAWEKYKSMKPDIVMLGDDNALKYLGKRIDDDGTPVVFLGINSNPRAVGIGKMKQVTGILERPLFKRNISEVNKVMNNSLKSVLILFDSGTTSQAAVTDAFKGKDTLKVGKVKATLKLIDTQSKWQQAVSNAKSDGYDAIIVGLYHTIVDDSGKHVPAGDILSWTSENTPVPPFAFWDFVVGRDKAIGGLVLFGEVQGVEAAKVVKRVLAGESPKKIQPAVAKKGRFYFSQAQLDRWSLTLPKSIQSKASVID